MKLLFYCTLCGKKLADSDACTRCGNDSSDKIQKRKGYFFEETVKPCAKYVVTQYQKQRTALLVITVVVVLCMSAIAIVFILANREANSVFEWTLPDFFGGGFRGVVEQPPPPPVPDPTPSPAPVIQPPSIFLERHMHGAEITFGAQAGNVHFTTDNTPPGRHSPSGSFTIDTPGTFHIRAVSVYGDSISGEAVQTVETVQLAPPAADQSPGSVPTGTEVMLSHGSGAEIRYTTDGSEPTGESSRHTAPIRIEQDLTVRARAFEGGSVPSEIVEFSFIAAPIPTPQPAQPPTPTPQPATPRPPPQPPPTPTPRPDWWLLPEE